MSELEVGAPAPDFSLTQTDGSTVSLSGLRGAPVVVFLYPRDNTSGCTLEAQDFTRLLAEFRAAGAQVFGLSKDSVKSHIRFTEKQNLSVPLLSDPDGNVVEAYGAWVEKSMYGRKFMGIERTTFLIDGDGRIAQIWRKVKVAGHAEEVLQAVKAL